jgi:sugar-specific transcriptional regulator TrmB
MFARNLEKLGFSPSEIKIYSYLLENGASYANRISSTVSINRTNVYEALDRLISKGVISFIMKNGVKWYEANDPKSLISLVQARSDDLKNIGDDISKDIGNLSTDRKTLKLEANIFTGKKGLRMIFEEILDTGRPIALIASQLQFQEIFGPYFELWHKKRIMKNISQRSIFPEDMRQRLNKRKLLEYHFVDKRFTNPTTTIIYGDNTVFIEWSTEPLVIKIQSEYITRSHLNHFNLLWDKSVPS